jgi:hypothetical protein
MKVYEYIKSNDHSFVPPGMKFVLYDGRLIPWDSRDDVGLDLAFLRLDIPERFNRFFKESGTIPVRDIPFIKEKIESLRNNIDLCQEEIDEDEREISKLKALE